MDEVVTDAPWVVTMEFLEKHNIHYVAHDALPYSDATGSANDVYDFVCARPDFGFFSIKHVTHRLMSRATTMQMLVLHRRSVEREVPYCPV